MEETTMKIKKAFPIHRFQQEEQYLSEMEQQGWRFEDIQKDGATYYVFQKENPVNDVLYQIDFITDGEETPEYHEKFEAAGFEQAHKWPGYGGCFYYYRKAEGDKQYVTTQSTSMSAIFNRIFMKFAIFVFLFGYLEYCGYNLMSEKIAAGTVGEPVALAVIAMMVTAGVFLVYFLYSMYFAYKAQKTAKSRMK